MADHPRRVAMTRAGRAALIGAVVVIVALSAAFAWTVRYAPDESSHLLVVHYFAFHTGWMPRSLFRYGTARGHAYNLFSPISYLPYLPFERLAGHVGGIGLAHHQLFVTRLGGVAVGVAELFAVLSVVRRMTQKVDDVSVVVVALAVNLVPQLRFIHGYINDDAVAILAGTLAFAVALRLLQRPRVTLTDAALVGLTLALGFHSKYPVFIILAALLALLVVLVVRSRAQLRAKLRYVGVAVALPVLLAGPWFIHVYGELDNRHVLASADNDQLYESTFYGRIAATPARIKSIARVVKHSRMTWRSSWADLPEYATISGGWLLLLFLAAAIGLLGLLVGSARVFTATGRAVGVAAVVLWGVLWIVAGSARSGTLPVSGRYLMPAGLVALAAIILGWAALLARLTRLRRPVLVAGAWWGAGLLALSVWGLAHVIAA